MYIIKDIFVLYFREINANDTMIRLTKIFRFETAHALQGYEGKCRFIHGHSYELHVTVTDNNIHGQFMKGTGILMDFKDIKKMVQAEVIELLDHKIVLSKNFVAHNPNLPEDNLFVMDAEPSAENLLIWISRKLQAVLPAGIQLAALKLYETADSFAEWINTDSSH
jgi:6-pyruvoyltetrahydropterin/6-carboxytetrahydropterin synthase